MAHSSIVAVFIVVSTILVVSHYVGKIQLDQYANKPVKLFLVRASIGVIPAFFMAGLLYFIIAMLSR